MAASNEDRTTSAADASVTGVTGIAAAPTGTTIAVDAQSTARTTGAADTPDSAATAVAALTADLSRCGGGRVRAIGAITAGTTMPTGSTNAARTATPGQRRSRTTGAATTTGTTRVTVDGDPRCHTE